MPTVNAPPQQPPESEGPGPQQPYPQPSYPQQPNHGNKGPWTAPAASTQEQPHPQQGAWTAPGEAPPKKKRKGCLIAFVIIAVVGLMIIAGLVQVFRDAVGSSESSTPEPFAVGDCLAMNSTTMEFVKLACSDPNAQQKVVGIEPEGGFEDCIDIDGAQSGVAQAEPERLVLCTGRPDVDPAQAINNITAGECLVFEEQQEYPRRADCSEPEAMRVDGRADDVESPADPSQPLPESICADSGFPQSEMSLLFGIRGNIAGVPEAHHRLACLSQP